MNCNNCQKNIPDKSIYCQYCGKKHNLSKLDILEQNLGHKFNSIVDENGNVQSEISLPLGSIQEGPDWNYYIRRASELSAEGELYEALEWCDKAMKLNPVEPIIYNVRGLVYFELDKNKEALRDYSSAIKLNPEFFAAYLNRGIIKSQLGLYEEAIADFDKALIIKPGNLNALNNRAGSKIEQADFMGAKDDITFVLRSNPKDSIALYILGKALIGLGKRQEAIEHFQTSAEGGFELSRNELKSLI